jgi:peroxiredoxin family protein
VLLESGTHARAHFAFVLASGAAAIGREVILFATNQGCHALLRDWSGLADAGRDTTVQRGGVAGLDELRGACLQLGVRMIACDAGLLAESIPNAGLLPEVERAGVVTFLEAMGTGQIICL